jgi:hypothetical protein
MAEFGNNASAALIDLSSELAATVEREPGDLVRCTRVGESRYRCNWWSPQAAVKSERGSMEGLGCTELRVRKSSLLDVSKTADGLMVRETPRAAGR